MPNTDSARVTIPFTCPYCGHFTEVESRFAGQSGPCVGCSNTITIPSVQAAIREAPVQRSAEQSFPWTKLGMIVGGLLCVGVLVVVVLSLMQPAIVAARDAARASECEARLREIGLALEDYHNEHKTYPPAIVYDESGKPMHSWRVLILPYLGPEAANVYAKYNMNEPWDSTENMKLVNSMPDIYRCPADTRGLMGETSYLAVVGRDTVLTDDPERKVTRRSIRDIPGETLIVIESAGSGVNWLEPKDIPVAALRAGLNSTNPAAPGSDHMQGVNALVADQTVVTLHDAFPAEELRAMATISGGEYIESLDALEE